VSALCVPCMARIAVGICLLALSGSQIPRLWRSQPVRPDMGVAVKDIKMKTFDVKLTFEDINAAVQWRKQQQDSFLALLTAEGFGRGDLEGHAMSAFDAEGKELQITDMDKIRQLEDVAFPITCQSVFRFRRNGEIRRDRLQRYGGCTYNWWWPALKELGDFILEARLNLESKELAWKRWEAKNETGSMAPIGRFNRTKTRFMQLWEMKQCPPGPCGPTGHPCPREFPGFECRHNEPCCGAYCCDDAGCYHDNCDNDGCFPFYRPCEEDARCGEPGHCKCQNGQ